MRGFAGAIHPVGAAQGCGRVNDAAIITIKKIASGIEIKNNSSLAMRTLPQSRVENVKENS